MGGACIVIATLLLSSCENFLKGAEVKEEIEYAIAYNNAKQINLKISCKEEMGKVYPETSYIARLNFDFEIQFIPNTQNYAIKDTSKIFKAVSRVDESQNRDDCIIFTTQEQTEDDKAKGVYRVKAKVVKDVNDILIQPECLELPRIISTSPDFYSDGINANAPIIISYNIPVEDSNTPKSQSLFQFGTEKIRLHYGSIDMSKYFENPVLNSEKTTIKIVPKAQELIKFINDQNAIHIDIKVSFGNEIAAVKEGVVIPLYESEASNFTIRYKPYEEKTPPVKETFFVTREPITLITAGSIDGTKIFTQEEFITDIMDDTLNHATEIIRNRNNGTIYIFGRYYDDESGVKSVVITEQRTHDRLTNARVMDTIYEFSYDENSPDAEFSNDGNGYTDFCIKHTLVSEDGAVNVEATVNDACQNGARTERLSVIKQTYFDFYRLDLYNMPREIDLENNYIPLDVYNDNLKNLKIYNFVDDGDYYSCDDLPYDLSEGIFGRVVISGENFTIWAEYKDKNGITQKEKFSDYDEKSNSWNLDLDVDTVVGLKVKIIAIDDIGLQGGKEFIFPSKPAIISVEQKTENEISYKKVSFFCEDGPDCIQLFSKNQMDEFLEEAIVDNWSDNLKVNIYPNKDYWLLPCGTYNSESVYLCGELMHLVIATGEPAEAPTVSEEMTITKGNSNEIWKMNFSIENANDYDCIYCDFAKHASYTQGTKTLIIKKGDDYNPFVEIETRDLYNCKFCFTFYGIKDGIKSKTTTIDKQKITDPKYDDKPPYFYLNRSSYDVYTAKFGDMESGPELCVCTIGEKTFVGNGSNTSITIPASLIIDNIEEYNVNGKISKYCKINYLAKDIAGNIIESETHAYQGYYRIPLISSYTKNNSSWDISIDEVPIFITKGNSSNMDWRFSIYKLEASGQWTTPTSLNTYAVADSATGNYTASFPNSFNFPDNSFVKIIIKNSDNYGFPNYFYTGDPSSGVYDNIWVYGNKMVVTSDAPVFVHTLCTSRPYEECKDWSIVEWEDNHEEVESCYYGDFLESNHAASIHDIPVDQIEDGNCYVVIAHFANNTTKTTNVMIK